MVITGILGYPLKTTFSPLMHNAVFKMLGIDGIYLRLPVRKEQLEEAILGLRALGFRGVNVTIPYKIDILDFLDDIEDKAKAIGSVNTILVRDAKLMGYNTDAHGFDESLRAHGIDIAGRNIMLIGAGGAARACAYVLKQKRPRRFFVANRTLKKSQLISKSFDAEVIEFDQIKKVIRDVDIIFNATSINLQRSIIPLAKSRAIYYDLNYRFRMMKQKGMKVINGLMMLVEQGAYSFYLWTGKQMPVELVKRKVGLKND